MADDASERLKALQASFATDADLILKRKIPETILRLTDSLAAIETDESHVMHDRQLNSLLSHPPSAPKKVDPAPAATKKRKLEANGTSAGADDSGISYASTPQELIDVFDFMRNEYDLLASLMDTVKVWVTLQIPTILDGDNSGVQVQEECIQELSRSEDSAINLSDQQSKFWAQRGKIASKLVKYPTVADYSLALKELDKQQFLLSRQRLLDLRNVYLFSLDLLQKNIERVRKPRAENSRNMY